MTSEEKAKGDLKALTRQTGFWRRVERTGALDKGDLQSLRTDLQRLEDLVDTARGDQCCDNIADELAKAREIVQADMGTQALVMHALIEILIEKNIMTEDEFADKLDEIDMRDGVMDGMLHPTANDSRQKGEKQ